MWGTIRLLVKEAIHRYWLDDDLLYAKGYRLYVLVGAIRRELLKESHDSKWAGHPGRERMYVLLSRSYYWTQLRDDVELYVKTCLVCQEDKVEQRKVAGLLQPLPDMRWALIYYGLSGGFPNSGGSGNKFNNDGDYGHIFEVCYLHCSTK